MRLRLSLGAVLVLLLPATDLKASPTFTVSPTGGGAPCINGNGCADPDYFYVNTQTLQFGAHVETVPYFIINNASPKGWAVDTTSGAQWDVLGGDVGAI